MVGGEEDAFAHTFIVGYESVEVGLVGVGRSQLDAGSVATECAIGSGDVGVVALAGDVTNLVEVRTRGEEKHIVVGNNFDVLNSAVEYFFRSCVPIGSGIDFPAEETGVGSCIEVEAVVAIEASQAVDVGPVGIGGRIGVGDEFERRSFGVGVDAIEAATFRNDDSFVGVFSNSETLSRSDINIVVVRGLNHERNGESNLFTVDVARDVFPSANHFFFVETTGHAAGINNLARIAGFVYNNSTCTATDVIGSNFDQVIVVIRFNLCSCNASRTDKSSQNQAE